MADYGIIAEVGPRGKYRLRDAPCCRLILMTRYPTPGSTKTRLIPALGPQGAAILQQRMTEVAVALMRRFCDSHPVVPEVRYEGGSGLAMREWLGDDLAFLSQGKGTLGERLANAFDDAFSLGSTAVVVMGADCPSLNCDHLAEAFVALRQHDLVVGPAMDGGYYLIGLAKPAAALFRAIPWGSSRVLGGTLERAASLGLSCHLLEQLVDVDRPEDLKTASMLSRAIGR